MSEGCQLLSPMGGLRPRWSGATSGPKRITGAYRLLQTRSLIAVVATSVHDRDRGRKAFRRAVRPRSGHGKQPGHLPPRACMSSTPRTNALRSFGTAVATWDADRMEVSVCRSRVRALAGIAFGVGPWRATVPTRLPRGVHRVLSGDGATRRAIARPGVVSAGRSCGGGSKEIT